MTGLPGSSVRLDGSSVGSSKLNGGMVDVLCLGV